MPRREEYRATARAIAVYLAERQRPDGGFPGPDNYGVACALWLWSHFGVDFARQLDRAWQRLRDEPPSSHGEFNIYALLHARGRMGEGPVDALVRRLRLDGRHSANWMLLRAVCRAQAGPCHSLPLSALTARAALLRHTRGGLIEDRPGVRSLAYHAFCGALLADLWQITRKRWAGRAAVRAAASVAPFILPNGDTLYIGRGQQQIFGYGALLHLLEAVAQIAGESRHADLADRVFARLTRFRRRDGSFPLVLREGEELEPWHPDASRPGWFTYNRYADYLPFLGCLLLKAAQQGLPALRAVAPAGRRPDLRLVERERYTAVLSRPGGPPTNDLAFPYLCLDAEALFPCYGREGTDVRSEEAPLPYGLFPDGRPYSFRDQLRYRLTDDGLVGGSKLVRHERRFEFQESGFTCRDEITFLRTCSFGCFIPANFLFRCLRERTDGWFETWQGKARAILDMEPRGQIHPQAAITASGRLVALRHMVSPFHSAPGQRVRATLRVTFL